MIFVCLLWKSFIFDILGVSGDGLLSAGPDENLQRGRVRPVPGSVSLSLSGPGSQESRPFQEARPPSVWPLCTPGLGLGTLPGPET